MLRRLARRIKRREPFLWIDRHYLMLTLKRQDLDDRLWRRILMRPVETRFVAAVLAVLTTSTGAMAQSYYDDQVCRQYAGQQVAAIQNQANAQAFGSTLLGAGLGAAIGGAVGGGRGAGIGAASGGVLGGATGIANAQNAAAYAPQQFNAYYSQCMASRTPPPPAYYPPAPAYAPSPGYAPPSSSSAGDLNRQELNRVGSGPQYPPYSAYPPSYPPQYPSYPPRY
jgi:hypothetical protein